MQVAYAIGVAEPVSINVETFGTSEYSSDELVQLIEGQFDMRPGAIIRDLRLRRPIFRNTAAFGHFGRDDIDAPWESTDKAEALQQAATTLQRAADAFGKHLFRGCAGTQTNQPDRHIRHNRGRHDHHQVGAAAGIAARLKDAARTLATAGASH